MRLPHLTLFIYMMMIRYISETKNSQIEQCAEGERASRCLLKLRWKNKGRRNICVYTTTFSVCTIISTVRFFTANELPTTYFVELNRLLNYALSVN